MPKEVFIQCIFEPVKSSGKYWLIQFVGWSLFAILNIYISFFEPNDSHIRTISINVLLMIGGIGITHFFRRHLIQNKWFELPTTQLISRVLIANILLAFIFCILQYFLLIVFFPEREGISALSHLARPFMSAYIILLGWSLIYFTWSYIEGNRSRIITQLQMENDMKELELKSMRSNLQPHFIFNSLNSIRALVKEEPDAAREAVTKLSKLLRTSISTKENSISLDEELDIVENYLHLEKIRFEERLQYNFEIEPKTRTMIVPPMLLQNMVENAVKHGISLRENGGTILLSAKADGELIRIQIKNEGHINEENKMKGTGFGMNSSQKRLHHLYPDAPEIKMLEENDHVIVEICIPNKIKPYEN